MKKAFVAILVLVLVVSLWINLRQSGGIKLSFLEGETQTLQRGDLTIPITANGTIEPKDRVDIKSEAGGIVVKTPFEVGDMVTEGDLLVELDPEDEQRMVDSADKVLRQARINLGRAETTLFQRENIDLPMALKNVEKLQQDFDYTEFVYNKTRDLQAEGQAHQDEWRRVASNYFSIKAQLAQANIEVERARNNIKLARLDVQQQELAVARAEDDLDQAQERLSETRIVAPVDGMLSRMLAKRGTVISSGSASFGGGTLLATLSDISELYVRAEIDESDIGRVREIAPPHARPGLSMEETTLASAANDLIPIDPGQTVKVSLEAFPDEEFTGVIDLIEPEAVTIGQVATFIVRIRLTSENFDKLSFLGMQANVEFVSESVTDAVLVPNEAVHYLGEERGVYIPADSEITPGKKVPKFVPFKAGLDNGRYTQVISGLQAGQEVYIKLPKDREGREITRDE